MPMQRSLYPPEWQAIAYLKKDLANWTCEQCDRPCRKPGETEQEFIPRLPLRWYPDLFQEVADGDLTDVDIKLGRFVLTVAHLDHNPANCQQTNLRALCAPCHCRYDLSQMARKKMLKRERAGQLSLFA